MGCRGSLWPEATLRAEGEPYRSVVVASERITDEDWTEVPDGSVFAVEPDLRLAVEPL